MAFDDHNPYASPRALSEDDDRRPVQFRMSPAPFEYVKDRGDSLPFALGIRFWGLLTLGGLGCWARLAVSYPLLWAIGTVVVIATVLGIITARIGFHFEHPLQLWGWSLLFSLGWLLLAGLSFLVWLSV